MIYSLHGKLAATDTNYFVVDCGGVGYKCTASLITLGNLPKLNEEVLVYTHMVVREDAVELYGFLTAEELNCFKLLTSVSSVGNKIGIAMLSEFTPEQMYLHIASGDAKAITRAQGVGIKIAQRVVLELKDKVGKGVSSDCSEIFRSVSNIQQNLGSSQGEAIAALVALGYTQSEASLAVSRVEPDVSVEEIIKQSLKLLSRSI